MPKIQKSFILIYLTSIFLLLEGSLLNWRIYSIKRCFLLLKKNSPIVEGNIIEIKQLKLFPLVRVYYTFVIDKKLVMGESIFSYNIKPKLKILLPIKIKYLPSDIKINIAQDAYKMWYLVKNIFFCTIGTIVIFLFIRFIYSYLKSFI